MKHKSNQWLLAMAFLLAVVILGLDTLFLPLGVAGGVPYVAVILIAMWLPRRRHVLYAAIVVSVFTFLGYFCSAPGGIPWLVLANRFLALFAIWSTALVGYQRIRAEQALRESENEAHRSRETLAMSNTVLQQEVDRHKQTQKELESALDSLRAQKDEFEQFNSMAVGRELRMVELKQEVNELAIALGGGERYDTNAMAQTIT